MKKWLGVFLCVTILWGSVAGADVMRGLAAYDASDYATVLEEFRKAAD
jgi:hypothetical protein